MDGTHYTEIRVDKELYFQAGGKGKIDNRKFFPD